MPNTRPLLHFTSEAGWINDPNGLCYENGRYHLFAQYYPQPHWGPMHWYHAVSRDLLTWEHLPIALEPDELGFIFSGSAVIDTGNTSGLGDGEHPPMVAIYTSHGTGKPGGEKGWEQQSLAYSLDGVSFVKYPGNPVIPNSTQKDFRDPKVFRDHARDRWGLVLAVGDHVEFYASKDLIHWEKTGSFGPQGNHSAGVWECPELFPLEAGGKEVWVLLVSMGPTEENQGSRTQYFTGTFNGETFVPDGRFGRPEFIDSGFDNYAGVTFYGTDERILLGWASNWVYAGKTPTEGFRGQMTVPRTLRLIDTPKAGLRLASAPVSDRAFGEAEPCGALPGDVFKLTVTGEGSCRVTLSNPQGQELCFGVDGENNIYFDRAHAGAADFDENFQREHYSVISAPRFYDGPWKLELTFDRTVCELFADNGTRAFTNLVFPGEAYTKVEASGGAEVTVARLRE